MRGAGGDGARCRGGGAVRRVPRALAGRPVFGWDVVRLLPFVFWVRVEDFGPLRVPEESEELRFFRQEEFSGLDVPCTSGPILDA